MRLRIAGATYALIAANARCCFNGEGSSRLPDGDVEIEVNQGIVERLGSIAPDPDLAIRRLLLGEARAVN